MNMILRVFASRFLREKYLHLLVLPAVIYIVIFQYAPMYGLIIAFKKYSFVQGIMGSPWVGFEHFINFFESFYFLRVVKNTLYLSVFSLVFGFPVPLIFALLLNEVRNRHFKKLVQTASYFPYFVSVVIVVGMMYTLLSPANGVVNVLMGKFGIEPVDFLRDGRWFRFLYVSSGIWQTFGWNSILYLAVLASIPKELYEAAYIDGANRFKQIYHITLPGVMPTAVILLILSIGGLMNVGFEKVLLMYSPGMYDVADIISTYVYRKALLGGEFSFGTAVGLFNNIINFVLLIIANQFSKKITEVSLW